MLDISQKRSVKLGKSEDPSTLFFKIPCLIDFPLLIWFPLQNFATITELVGILLPERGSKLIATVKTQTLPPPQQVAAIGIQISPPARLGAAIDMCSNSL